MKCEIKGSKPYVGKIVGTNEKYGFELEFLKLNRISSTYHVVEIVEDGCYRLPPGAVVGSLRIDTGFIRITNGVAVEISKDAVAIVKTK